MKTAMKYFLILMAICFQLSAFSQTIRAYEKAGDGAMSKQDYYSAYVYFFEASQLDTSIVRLKYKFAKAAYYWQSYDEANMYFKMSDNPEISKRFSSFEYDWGLNQMALGKYDEAMALFQRFLKKGGLLQRKRKKAKNKIQACKNANQIINKPIDVKIKHLDENINSPYSEFAPLEYNGELYFSSLKFKQKRKRKEQYFSRILKEQPESKAKPLRKNINLKDIHNAHVSFGKDGHWMYFTRCENVKTGGIRCKIYRRDLRERRPKDVLLPEIINIEGFTATQPCIGVDSILGKEWLFFASDRKGGKGGMDIWSSEIKNDGTFAKPKNAGRNINTIGDEISPFYFNKMLYFSSNEHIGLGGYDVFTAKQTGNNKWLKPKNIGYPINSSYNDIYLTVNEDGYSGYFSSNRKGTILLTKSACCNDLFAFALPKPKSEQPKEPKRPKEPDTLIAKIDEPKDTLVEKPVKTVQTFEEELSKLLPIALYFDNDQPNPRTTKTTTKLSYDETYFTYFAKKETFRKAYASLFSKDRKIDAEIKVNAFFENEVKNSYNKLIRLANLLLIELQKGKTYKIYIKGYTSRLASSDYNISLSKRRISSVKNFITTYNSGIFKPYLADNQLQIVEVPFGETQSKEAKTDEPKDKRAAIYGVEASRERRVEIIEVK